MASLLQKSAFPRSRLTLLTLCTVLIYLLLGNGPAPAHALAPGPPTSGGQSNSTVVCPGGQCFTDVPPGSTFYAFVNALYLDNIISGYPCGSITEPCDDQSRPYYRPNNNVTRAQMSKFVDNGRRNIANAVGTSLTLVNPLTPALIITSNHGIASNIGLVVEQDGSGMEGIESRCGTGVACTPYYGLGGTGTGGFFSGNTGVSAVSANGIAVSAYAFGTTDIGVVSHSSSYHGAEIDTASSSAFSLEVVHPAGGSTAALQVVGSAHITGNLIVDGSKTGYVVDIMQNASPEPLQPGDVVTLVDSAPPVLGQIPLIAVRRASTPHDTGVVGVVDKAVYIPDPATRDAYDAQQQALQSALEGRAQADHKAVLAGTLPDYSQFPIPQVTISDADGTIHSLDPASPIPTGSYADVVTLGSYKAVKADASFAPIHKGDLLVSSPNPGYAMKATDRSQASGSTIGKALADLEEGSALIPILVTLK